MCEKRLYKHITVLVWKKPLQKTPIKYSKNESILKIAKIGHDAKALAFAKCQCGSKIKNAKKVRKTIVQAH